jgi:hypothetical protein
MRNSWKTLSTSRKIEAARSGVCPDVLGTPKPLEVDQRQAGEDHETGHCVDQGSARHLYEDKHDPEPDERDQPPAEGARERRQVPPSRVADGTDPRDELRRRSAGLPNRLRIRAQVVADGRGDGEPEEEEPEAEDQTNGKFL